jgi:hypothetical protein
MIQQQQQKPASGCGASCSHVGRPPHYEIDWCLF